MHKSLIQSVLPPKWHSYLALVAFLLLGTFAHAQSVPPDLTAGGVPSNTGTITLGPTGLRGWAYSVGISSADSRQLLVKVIDAGSPADGIFLDCLAEGSGKWLRPLTRER